MDDIHLITSTDSRYPTALKAIPHPPRTLYYRGTWITEEPRFAVVGTRRPSSYGKEATANIVSELTYTPLTIVSGLAPGIDTIAHQTFVQRTRRTIAVLGTGLDEKSIYPQENVALARNIIKTGGCLISEFPPGTPGYPNNFRERNRIISGLSLGVLVVEAQEKSGSLITANHAKLQHKKLFAVPGSIYASHARGPNKLIKEGATLVETADDILSVLGIEMTPRHYQEIQSDNPLEASIITVLREGSLPIDHIIQKTHQDAATISATLAIMELSGKVRNLGGNIYALHIS